MVKGLVNLAAAEPDCGTENGISPVRPVRLITITVHVLFPTWVDKYSCRAHYL